MSVATNATNAWRERSEELAEFTLSTFVNRTDRFGGYNNGDGFTGYDLTSITLQKHFRGDGICGVHSTSPDSTSRWLSIDIDNHDGDESLLSSNFTAAADALSRLEELGFYGILEDSNGDGGYHIWIPFAEPAPTEAVYRLGKQIVGDAHETFPKQATLSGKGLGNWLRLPGRHHSRDHWSRFWGDGEWLSYDDSVALWLNPPLNDPAALDAIPQVEEPGEEAAGEPEATGKNLSEYLPTGAEEPNESIVKVAEREIEQRPWHELLRESGWKLHAQNGAESEWTRPGKKSGCSATLNHGGSNLFHVFSTATDLPADGANNGKSYGKFRFWAWSNKFTDAQQVDAAKELLGPEVVAEHDRQWRERNGRNRDDKTDNTDETEPEGVLSVLSSDFEDWPEPEQIAGPSPEPMLPEDFPGIVGEIVEAVAENSETPVELPGLVAIGILATACQQRFQIAGDGQYTEPLNLWCCPSLESGNRKTAVVNELAKPVRMYERELRAEKAESLKQAESLRRTLEKRIDALRSKAARADDQQQLRDIQREIEAVERELPPQEFAPTLLADDCTPEHIATLMSHHGERLTVLSDEAGIFELMAGRYNRGVANLDVYLQGHAGSPVRVDRGSRESIDLERPCLSVVVSPQPSVLEEIGKRKDFSGRGLLARFLFAVPQSRLGFRSHRPKPIPESVSGRWTRTVQRMLAIEQQTNGFDKPEPQTLYLSPEAYRLWKAEQLANEVDMRPGNTWANQTAWASKYPGAVLRIAGVMHVALCVENRMDPAPTDVAGDTMAAAVRIGRKIKAHTLKSFGVMALNDDQRFARKIIEWLRRDEVSRFTSREAAIHCNSAGSSKELEGAFQLLAERGWIRQGDKRQPKGGGRPSQPWDVNPAVTKLDDKTDITPGGAVSSVLSSDFEANRATRPQSSDGNLTDVDWTNDAF